MSRRDSAYRRLAETARLAMVLAATAALLDCRRSRYEEIEVDLAERVRPARSARGGSGAAFRFGLAAMISPRETASDYATLARELGAAIGAGAELLHGKTYREVNELLVTGRLDAAFLCTGGYLELAARVPVEILAVPRVGGRTSYRSLLLVRERSGARSILDLKGRRFAFSDPLSLSGHLYPRWRLRAAGLDPDAFFARAEFLGSHDRSIQAVRREVVDAAAVDSLVYEALRAKGGAAGLRVLESSPELGIPPVVARASLPGSRRGRYREALLRLHERELARAALSRIGIERFVEAPPDLYRGAAVIWRSARER